MRVKSVVLLSGGLDSSANLAMAVEKDEPLLAITADYGQRASRKEISAARALCDHYGVPHETVELPWLGRLGGSSLTDTAREVPVIAGDSLDDSRITRGTAAAVWVPNRNGILIGVAAAYAERLKAECVLVGFNREEAATFPDNSEKFLQKSAEALALSTANSVRVYSYTVGWDKRQIVTELGRLRNPFPFERVWACYHGGEKPCGECESCRRFARALGR